MQRRRFGSLCLALLSFLVVPELGWAQDYPSRPIRLIITSPAGSLVDVLGRLIAEELGLGRWLRRSAPAPDHGGPAGGLAIHLSFPDVWFARHEELGRWALAADVDEHSYASRFFGEDAAASRSDANVSSRRRSGAEQRRP